MNACWLLDAEMFEQYREQLVAAIQELGHQVKQIRAPRAGYRWEDEGCSSRQTFPENACVIVHGDIDLATRVYRERRWTPGTFGTIENYACSSYYCHFGQFVLNSNYIMLPNAELKRCSDFLFDTLAVDDKIFIRPDSPLKLFTGQTATRQTFDEDLEFMAFYEFPRNSLVLVSSPKEVVTEWRFVIADRQVVTGSEYKHNGTFVAKADYDQRAHDLAATIASCDYQPDPVWVLDICKTADGSYRLLEIGGFSFADLYATDKKAVVAAVSATAIRIWNQSFQ